MDKLQGRIAGMPRDAANFWVGVLGVVWKAHVNHSEALQEPVDHVSSDALSPVIPSKRRPRKGSGTRWRPRPSPFAPLKGRSGRPSAVCTLQPDWSTWRRIQLAGISPDMHHDLRMVSVASKDDSESAPDTASDRTITVVGSWVLGFFKLLTAGPDGVGDVPGTEPVIQGVTAPRHACGPPRGTHD